MTDTAELLRQLIEYAGRGGADPAWLHSVADHLVAVHTELAALRRQIDPRKARTARLAGRVKDADAALRCAGVTSGRVVTLQARFGLSRARVYELLVSGDTPDKSRVGSGP